MADDKDQKNINDLNRKQRRAARREGHLDDGAFIKQANAFIDVANRANKDVKATELHLAFLYGSARYSAYVGNAVLKVENHEEFVMKMTKQYQEMLRQNLADPGLAGADGAEDAGKDAE